MDNGSCLETTAGRILAGAAGKNSWTKRKPFNSRYCRRQMQCAVKTGTMRHREVKMQLEAASRTRTGMRDARKIDGISTTGVAVTDAMMQ